MDHMQGTRRVLWDAKARKQTSLSFGLLETGKKAKFKLKYEGIIGSSVIIVATNSSVPYQGAST